MPGPSDDFCNSVLPQTSVSCKPFGSDIMAELLLDKTMELVSTRGLTFTQRPSAHIVQVGHKADGDLNPRVNNAS